MLVGPKPETGSGVLLCEGWATASSLHEASRLTTFAALSSGNLGNVCEILVQVGLKVLICADLGETGQKDATTAAQKHGCRIISPTFPLDRTGDDFNDFNDLHRLSGTQEVGNLVRDGWRWEPLSGATESAKPPDLEEAPGGVGDSGRIEHANVTERSEESQGQSIATNCTSAKLESAIIPAGSWLERYMDFARGIEESADCYLVGAILPVLSACLERRVSFPFGEGDVFTNMFHMLAGKPGDRKSVAINLAEKIGKLVLPTNKFLPDMMSVGAMVDEYDLELGGSPDKILIADEANPFLGMLRKSNYGERVGQRLLNLYDCKGLFEAFKRNKGEDKDPGRRYIPQTSTSIVFGGTFNVAAFQGQEIRSGLQRRFEYYLAEGHGRFIPLPQGGNHHRLLALAEPLRKLLDVNIRFTFSDGAQERWISLQRENRRLLAVGGTPDAILSRLNGQPMHTIKKAQVFELALWVERDGPPPTTISESSLEVAVRHSELCHKAALELDTIGDRAAITESADLLLARVRTTHAGRIQTCGFIVLTRTEITSQFCDHGRRSSWTTDDVYLRVIPNLILRGLAAGVNRPGKQTAYGFRADDPADVSMPCGNGGNGGNDA